MRYNPALKGHYTTNIKEFVAGLADPTFRNKLQSIDQGKPSSIWTRIKNTFKRLLGIHTSSTYYNRMMNALDNALDAFDMDTYLQYTGMKSQLQQAYNDHRVDFEDMATEELKSMLKNAIKEGHPTLSDISHVVSERLNNAIKTNKWDKDTIDEFNNLIEKIQNGEIVYRRIHEEGEPSPSEVSQAHAGASILLRGSYGTAEEKSRNPKEQYEAESAQGKEQERKVEAWAKAEDLWLNDYTDEDGNKAKTLED